MQRNVFDVLMHSQRSLQKNKLPDPVKECNMEECSEVQSFGVKLVKALHV